MGASPLPLAGEGKGEGAAVLNVALSEKPKHPSSSPSPHLRRGEAGGSSEGHGEGIVAHREARLIGLTPMDQGANYH